MVGRVAALLALALVLSACDLLKPASASGSPDAQLAVPGIGTVAPGPSTSASPNVSLVVVLPSPTAFATTLTSVPPSPSLAVPSASLTPPPSFTEKVPPTIAVPTFNLPTFQPVITPTPTPSPSPTIARPTITSFVPESGLRGSLVTINGTSLASVTLVLFGDIATTPIAPRTATTLTVVVPSTAVSAPISLVSPAGVVTSARFFIVEERTAPPSPTCAIRVQCGSPSPPANPSPSPSP